MAGKRALPSPLAGEVARPKAGSEGGRGEKARSSATPPPGSPGGTTPTPSPSPQGGGENLWPHLAGRLEGGTHVLPVRVYYEDTDFSGVVYHASYLRFLERGRTDLLRLAGVDQSALHADGTGLMFAVRRMTIDFLKPARMDDVLIVETRTDEVRGASLVIAQAIRRGEETLLTADVRVAALAGGRPARIPDGVRAALKPDPEEPQ